MSARSLAVLVLAALAAPVLRAQTAEPERRPWTPDDVVTQETLRSFQVSDDGRRALWIRAVPDEKKDAAVPVLVLADLVTGELRDLTVGQESISDPVFIPGADAIAFLSAREFPAGTKGPEKEERGQQIWRLDLAGGEARPVTDFPGGVASFAWRDPKTVLVAARERLTRLEAEARKRKDDSILVEDPDLFRAAARRLFRYDVEKKELRRLTRNEEPLAGFRVSPDGRRVVATYDRSPSFEAEGDVPPRIVLHDLETGAATELFADRKSRPLSFHWRHDSSGGWFLFPRSTHDGETEASITVVYRLDATTGALAEVDLGHERGLGETFQVTPDGFVASLANGARPLWRRYREIAGGALEGRTLAGEDVARLHELRIARNADRVIYVAGTASEPDHLKRARLAEAELVEPAPLYRPNGGFADLWIARTEVRRWKGALDEEVEGILYYPRDHDPERRHPLVLITHGGPHALDEDRFTERWANSPQLYAQRGAFVLKTNYHGSAGYGLAFGESIRGRYSELELIDMFSGIRELVKEGKVDPERMGLVGWSNGAILSTAAVALAHRFAPGFDYDFKVCCPGAGDVNWTSDYGNCAFGGTFDEYYLGGTPWTNLAGYVAKSPLFEVERVRTPTIIFFGTEDTAVPTSQGWEWFRALHRVGKAPVRFVLFPGEPHGLRKLTHQRRKLVEELAFVDRHLFGRPAEHWPEALVEGSPAEIALLKSAFPRVAGRYGREVAGALVPETRPWKPGVEVGRFEVTRAQWAAFDEEAVEGMRPDHPALGVDGVRARRYVAWLRERTGLDWRLLTRDELRELAALAGPTENTLESWAGYDIAESDAGPLRERLAPLGPERLVEEVGSRAPAVHRVGGRRELFFDLGGNAAEIAVDDEGRAEAAGGWALGRRDDRVSRLAPAPAAWTGLRVAIGPAPESP
ncbi:MAG: prolyl oligopeptidase family serine peptidase [Planctomycetota bacterium]